MKELLQVRSGAHMAIIALKVTYCIDSFLILVVVSRYNVSLGGNLWKTTLEIEDLPLLEQAHQGAKFDLIPHFVLIRRPGFALNVAIGSPLIFEERKPMPARNWAAFTCLSVPESDT